MPEKIIIKGAREHNLKNIDVEIPKNQLVVFTGLSGSGKSSLAFDTIYAEGQRRYVESLSSYARQFLGVMSKPDVDYIEGLSPAISIDQKTTSHNPRSTVGTVTEIYDYLRVLYARVGHPHCPNCNREISHQTIDQIVEQVLTIAKSVTSRQCRLLVLAPVVQGRKGEYLKLFENLIKLGHKRVRIDREIHSLDEGFVIIKTNKHNIEAVIDRIVVKPKNIDSREKSRLREAVEAALKMADGETIVSVVEDSSLEFPNHPQKMSDHLFSQKFSCPVCNLSFSEIEPRLFSFNTPHGACPNCTGLGFLLKIDPDLIVNPDLSISEGGILPLGSQIDHDTWFMRQIKTVANQYQISLTVPIKLLNLKLLNLILCGTSEKITVRGTNREGHLTSFSEVFEGVIPRLERLYKETQSDWSRQNIERFMRNEICQMCLGKRLKKEALAITINSQNIISLCETSIQKTLDWVNALPKLLNSRENQIARPIIKELSGRLTFLLDVGLDYLSLSRSANTLAGGETQRIRLASQIGSGLSGVLYVLDEPSIGLHQRDNQKLIATLKRLKALGNTVIVVEHDRETMESADWIVDFGPGAGEHGGEIISQGTIDHIKKDKNSLTGEYLSGRRIISQGVTLPRQGDTFKDLVLLGCREHNLKNLTVKFPLGNLIGITGVSGSGKSTLINDILYHALMREFYPDHKTKPGIFDALVGLENIDKVIFIDQSPIGRTPRSNPATYTGTFTFIREVFATTVDARTRGFKAGKFSFNVKGGRCEACQGEGQIKIEMQFLPDVYVDCEVCRGKRYETSVLEVEYKNKNIAQVLDMTIEVALEFFAPIPTIRAKLETLLDVGLGYLHLGQPAPTLSGGEAQRVKLATELSKKSTGKTVYLLDEPTTGLHFADLERLLNVLKKLVSLGNTVIVIEHNLDIIKNCDYLIDLGPEGGDNGGEIIAAGNPSQIAADPKSSTGKFLKEIL